LPLAARELRAVRSSERSKTIRKGGDEVPGISRAEGSLDLGVWDLGIDVGVVEVDAESNILADGTLEEGRLLLNKRHNSSVQAGVKVG